MISDSNVIGLLYLVTIICFILALRFLSSPKHARKGNWIGGVGMLIAIATTLLTDGIGNWALMVPGIAIGSAVGLVGARTVKMTAMPQMVALFNGVGGGAAALVALAEFHNLAPDPGRIGADRTVSIVLGADRLDLVRGFSGRVREAAGADRRAPDRVPGPERRQLADRARRGRLRHCGDRGRAGAVGARRADPARAPLRRDVRAADRRRRHARRDLAAQRLHGLAASATGFDLSNTVLIVSGMLVGASGNLLTLIMARR